jgi:hypothetical protein
MHRTHTDIDAFDRLKRGELPFVGRDREFERIVGFWRETLESATLRALAVVGEAGIGKSTLLQRSATQIEAAGGLVVQSKLLPDSTTALLATLAVALDAPASRTLLREQPQPTISSVAGALRRLARLRPTLLVIEDTHLLNDDTTRDLSLLLDALADETLSIVCATRPIDNRARASLQRYVVDEVALGGLDESDLAAMWSALGDGAHATEAGRSLARTTLGNPLAVRVAVCSAASRSDVTHLFAAVELGARQSVGLLTDGMMLGLHADDIDTASRLAALGEAFSPMAARALLGDREPMLARLRDHGIIAHETVRTAPLHERSSATE